MRIPRFKTNASNLTGTRLPQAPKIATDQKSLSKKTSDFPAPDSSRALASLPHSSFPGDFSMTRWRAEARDPRRLAAYSLIAIGSVISMIASVNATSSLSVFLALGYSALSVGLWVGLFLDPLFEAHRNRPKLEAYNRSIDETWQEAIRNSPRPSQEPEASQALALSHQAIVDEILAAPDWRLPWYARYLLQLDPQDPALRSGLRHFAMAAPRSKAALIAFLRLAERISYDAKLTAAVLDTLEALGSFLKAHEPKLSRFFEEEARRVYGKIFITGMQKITTLFRAPELWVIELREPREE